MHRPWIFITCLLLSSSFSYTDLNNYHSNCCKILQQLLEFTTVDIDYKEKSMFKRHIKPYLAKALERSPVVLLNGARQVGKSTLVKEFQKEKGYTYLTFDDETVYVAAKNDPTGFINGLQKPIIIDEVQRVPEIFLPIKIDIDNNRIAGRYLLTGSANPLLIPHLGDSLAGRMEIVDLMPLSQGEITGTIESWIDTAFSAKPFMQPQEVMSKRTLYQKIITGGYPSSVLASNDENQEAWMKSYINLLLQRDIKDLAQIEKITELPNLLKILAHRASNLLNVAEISRECKMVAQTVHRYIALLQTIFIITLQQSWHTNLSLRYIKSPKVYLVDSGLLSYLLGINLERSFVEQIAMGKVLENFILNELKKQATWSKTGPDAYHFRTTSGTEVDILLENRQGEIVGIEVKSAEKVSPDDFKGLKLLAQNMDKKFIQGVVFYGGSQVVPFGNKLWALPITCLWQ